MQVVSVICSYAAMACDVLLIIAMTAFLLKYCKTMQVMLATFIQMNTKNTGIQSAQADQIGRTYPALFTLNLPKEDEIIYDLREITAMEYVAQVIMIIVCIAVVIIVMYFCCTKCRYTHTICRATTRPPRPSSTAECLHLIARLRGEQSSAASWEPRPPFEATEMD